MESLKYNLGPGGRFERHKRNQQTIYNSFNSFVERSYGVLIHVYLIKPSIPQMFSLVDVVPPCVAVDIRYISRLDVLMTRRAYLSFVADTLDIYTRLLLEIVSDVAILLGDKESAFRIFCLAEADGVAHAYDAHFLDMQNELVDESWIIKWYFCFAHEVGHVIAANRVRPWTKGLNFSEADVGKTMGKILQDPSILMICADYDFQIDPDAINLSDLVEEVEADVVGLEALSRFAFEALHWNPGNLEQIYGFCRELLWTFHFIYSLACCRVIAKAVIEGDDISSARNKYKQFSLGFLVRLKYIEFFFAHALGANVFAWIKTGDLQENADPSIARIAAEVSQGFWQAISPRIDACCLHCFEARDRSAEVSADPWVLDRFRQKCGGFGVGAN